MNPPLPIDGVLPPDLQGTLVRIGPGRTATADGARRAPAVRAPMMDVTKEGTASTTRWPAPSTPSSCGTAPLSRTSPLPLRPNANVFWQAGKVLALAESGLPQQFSRLLQPEEFDGGLRVPVASHVHRDAATGGRILFGVEQGSETALPSSESANGMQPAR